MDTKCRPEDSHGRDHLGGRADGRISFRMDREETWREAVDGFCISLPSTVAGFCEHVDEPLCSITFKRENF